MGVVGQWPYKSTGRVRALVLLALGVVKVATVDLLWGVGAVVVS
ncbi:hypothetical protein AB0L49_48715 [Streptomyces antimycoticus]